MNTQETTLRVEGMTCGSCVRHVREALDGLEGVAQVDVRLKKHEVVVRHDSRTAPFDKLVAALDKAGYEAKASS